MPGWINKDAISSASMPLEKNATLGPKYKEQAGPFGGMTGLNPDREDHGNSCV
jgi:hypothetical protein